MNARRVWAIARKEFIHVFRDARSLAMAIAIPMLLLVLFGYALTLDVDRVPMVVWDQDQTTASRELIARFTGSRYFSLKAHARDYREIEKAIDARAALVGLVVPRGFSGRVESRRAVAVQLIVDGSDANTATLAAGYAEAVALAYSQDVVVRARQHMGAPALRTPLEVRPRVWFNTELESKNFIIPGLIALIMMVIAAMLTSLTVAREWERGTMEQLISTPVRGNELILGKLLPYFSIGMFDMILAVLMGEFLFQVPLRGSVALLFAMAAIFLAGALSLGILISIVAKNQLLANQMAMVMTFLPSFLLSGFIYAITNMPPPIQVLTHIIPARYFIAMLKAIYLKGVGLEVVALEAVMLTLFSALVMLLARAKFKKKLV
jgi:ABC-2 type transport system permease protein